MLALPASPAPAALPLRGCALLDRRARAELARTLAERGYVVARVAPASRCEGAAAAAPGLLLRGRLPQAVQRAVDLALALRGAPPAAIAPEADIEAAAEDQIRRAQTAGAAGLCLVLPELGPLAEGRPLLDPADGAAIAAWKRLSERHAVVVLLDEADGARQMLAPVRLCDILGAGGVSSAAPSAAEPARTAPPPPAGADPAPVPHEQYAEELLAARGPRPARAVEELFRSRYVPLLDLVLRAEASESVRGAIESWRSGFERSYAEGFAALRLAARRPRMVLDAPDLAARTGRLNGARAVQMVLVDSLRFDLGQRIAARLRTELAGRAVCVDEGLLWAALPTTTPTQLQLLARGPAGLRDPEPPSGREPIVHRGRSATALVRVRIGQRQLLKLDVVEARLRLGGGSFEERMEQICAEVADVVVRFASTLPPRTLLYLFGDHGFEVALDPVRGTCLPATQGGASPEEVLVPAHAWLVGEVH
ncbi:MAG: hypothetical protein HY744_07455 [Deltaproteobacteria bacterium]|nr:hypothetical protein [Deltaproteobacteria bacterium]